MTATDLHISSTTPTTAGKFSPQKFRGHTLEILGVLSEFGGLTTREIADRISMDRKETYEYCRRGYHRGIFSRHEAWGWCASPLGMLVLSIVTTTTTTDHTTTTQQPHNNHTTTTRKPRQIDLAAFTSREDVDELDRAVVGVLSGAYEKTGQAFQVYADEYEVASVMGIAVQDVLPTLRHLRNENCIYFRRDSLGWKIGLLKAFLERMQHA